MKALQYILLLVLLICPGVALAAVPANCTQAIIGIADDWNNSHVTLSLVEKNAQGQWVRVMGPWKGRLGRNGLAWGLGLHSNPWLATVKREGDGRSPAGIFDIGGLWVTNKTPQRLV